MKPLLIFIVVAIGLLTVFALPSGAYQASRIGSR